MRRWITGIVLLLLATMAWTVWAQEQKSFAGLMDQAEKAWYADDYAGSNRALDEAIKLDPNKAESYWRKARNLYDQAEAIPRDQKPPKDELVKRYREIEALAAKCSALDPMDGNCTLWKGIGMGRRGTTQGVINSLGEMKELETVMLKTIALKPTYRAEQGKASSLADAYAVLGQFYRVVPDYRLLSLLFGTRGDLEKSVAMNQKAVEIEPKRIEHNKELGISLICFGQKRSQPAKIEEGKKILQGVAGLPVIKPSDKIDQEHAKMLLQDPSQACGYSRDAQQEQSEEAIKKTQQKP